MDGFHVDQCDILKEEGLANTHLLEFITIPYSLNLGNILRNVLFLSTTSDKYVVNIGIAEGKSMKYIIDKSLK